MTTIKQTEAIPATYPPIIGLSTEAAALDPAAIWLRIEAYTAHRWTARGVVWQVEGPCEWTPPLTPATVEAVEAWDGTQWTATAPGAAPDGYLLPLATRYRITATCGPADIPAAVSEAFRRLAEYLADEPDRSGLSSYSVKMGGSVEESYSRNPAHVARALQNSGAADLLRPYRRA